MRAKRLRQNARRGSRSDLRQGGALLGFERELPQAAQKFTVDVVGVRFEQHRKTMQMHA